MKVAISSIRVAKRIRKEAVNINELVENIRQNGLINPVAVMPVDGGEYQLLAGLRRLKAMEILGETEIESHIIPTVDAEAALMIEFSENEQRENFTLAERMEYAAIIEEIVKAKAHERKMSGGQLGGQGGYSKHVAPAPHASEEGRTRAIVSKKVGMKETSFRYAKFLADNEPEAIERIDNGEITIKAAYKKARAEIDAVEDSSEEQSEQPIVNDTPEEVATPVPAPKPHAPPAPQKRPKPRISAVSQRRIDEENERLRKLKEWDDMPLAEKVAVLEERVKLERTRANSAERELNEFKEKTHNKIFHGEGTIKWQRNRIEALEAALEKANARIKELEG